MKTQYETPEMLVYHFTTDEKIMADAPIFSGADIDPLSGSLDEELYFGE